MYFRQSFFSSMMPFAFSVKLFGIHITPADFADVPPRIGAFSIMTTASPFSCATTAAVEDTQSRQVFRFCRPIPALLPPLIDRECGKHTEDDDHEFRGCLLPADRNSHWDSVRIFSTRSSA